MNKLMRKQMVAEVDGTLSMVSGTNRLTPNLKKKKIHKITRDQVLHHVQI